MKFGSSIEVAPEKELPQVDDMLERPEEVLYLKEKDLLRTRTAAQVVVPYMAGEEAPKPVKSSKTMHRPQDRTADERDSQVSQTKFEPVDLDAELLDNPQSLEHNSKKLRLPTATIERTTSSKTMAQFQREQDLKKIKEQSKQKQKEKKEHQQQL